MLDVWSDVLSNLLHGLVQKTQKKSPKHQERKIIIIIYYALQIQNLSSGHINAIVVAFLGEDMVIESYGKLNMNLSSQHLWSEKQLKQQESLAKTF